MKTLNKIRLILSSIAIAAYSASAYSIDLTKSTIVYSKNDSPLAEKMANVLADDIERVSSVRPKVSTTRSNGTNVILSIANQLDKHKEICNEWERYAIDCDDNNVRITGSDPRGLAYGVVHVSEKIGVSPWYWFADVPVKQSKVVEYNENFISKSPSVKYRGIFINDEDWGMKTWASATYEKELGDIGPKTYDKVCELLLRLKANMLAPAMHSCTGAFYSHPESQKKAAEWGIMITTSHCEPLLFNNAALSEWDKKIDGEWNYLTNKKTIIKKLDSRIKETAQYDNIYTMGMRGLHDEAMKGSEDNTVRARTLECVFADQREILAKYKKKQPVNIPQIFVPYKETLDIYDAGLKVPDDITIVWPDDNYGYMKRVSDANEQSRSGGSGVYYHLSYLGTPHDNLWVNTTAPVLMYEELKKAYDAGANRYWLLNVGDIKPMELGVQQFFAMAWDFDAFNYDNANTYQAKWMSNLFGKKYLDILQQSLDVYYNLAWNRKPEFMGYEIQWDSKENGRLHDSNFASGENGPLEERMLKYNWLAKTCEFVYEDLEESMKPAFFEMFGYSALSANEMNKKFLYAQLNHETGKSEYEELSRAANDSINALISMYNTLLDGKWNQMMSCVPPGYVAKYHMMPEFVNSPTEAYKLSNEQHYVEFDNKIDINEINTQLPFRKIRGIGKDWVAVQLGNPHDERQNAASVNSSKLDFTLAENSVCDSVKIQISVLPMWPVSSNHSNTFGVCVDNSNPIVCENVFKEWSIEWKLQVLENRKDFIITLPIDKNKNDHVLSLLIGDPGQIVQEITYEYK